MTGDPLSSETEKFSVVESEYVTYKVGSGSNLYTPELK